MKCPKCNKEMANVYPEGTWIGKSRIGKEIGFHCANDKCKNKIYYDLSGRSSK